MRDVCAYKHTLTQLELFGFLHPARTWNSTPFAAASTPFINQQNIMCVYVWVAMPAQLRCTRVTAMHPVVGVVAQRKEYYYYFARACDGRLGKSTFNI